MRRSRQNLVYFQQQKKGIENYLIFKCHGWTTEIKELFSVVGMDGQKIGIIFGSH
jgi:hypothetical protein